MPYKSENLPALPYTNFAKMGQTMNEPVQFWTLELSSRSTSTTTEKLGASDGGNGRARERLCVKTIGTSVPDIVAVAHICQTCGRSFPFRKTLNRHCQTVHSSSSFHCSHSGCTKSFKRHDILERHEAEQHGSKTGTVECKTCGENVRERSLAEHMQSRKCKAAEPHVRLDQSTPMKRKRHDSVGAFTTVKDLDDHPARLFRAGTGYWTVGEVRERLATMELRIQILTTLKEIISEIFRELYSSEVLIAVAGHIVDAGWLQQAELMLGHSAAFACALRRGYGDRAHVMLHEVTSILEKWFRLSIPERPVEGTLLPWLETNLETAHEIRTLIALVLGSVPDSSLVLFEEDFETSRDPTRVAERVPWRKRILNDFEALEDIYRRFINDGDGFQLGE